MIDNCLRIKLQALKEKKFMNIYSVYVNTTENNKNPILIPQGFSFVAGIFNTFWALYHKMWLLALFAVIISAIANPAQPSYIVYGLNVGVLFIFGFFASEMREYYAKKKGFKLDDIILAHSEEEAEVRYYMRNGGDDV